MTTLESATTTEPSPVCEPKRLYRLVEPAYADLHGADIAAFYAKALERTLQRFGAECAIEGGWLGRREGMGWRTISSGEEALRELAERFERGEWELLRANRILFSHSPFPLAAWLIEPRAEWLMLFRLQRLPEEGPALLLQMARLAVAHRALESGWSGVLDRAREIQRSLLPDPLASLPGFEFAARSDSAEEVGGDVYDTIRLASDSCGLLIADASGHGLPAALEARDVVVGLRMGASWQLKIEATVEKLNRILCSSTLSSRFVSLIYGELTAAGTFDYINAGHPAPLLVTTEGWQKLPIGGRVLGVSPDSTYRVGHVELPPRGLLLLYTDGVAECPSPSGEEFGLERLAGIASLLAASSASHLCAAIFDALAEHTGGHCFPDDASLLVARRLV